MFLLIDSSARYVLSSHFMFKLSITVQTAFRCFPTADAFLQIIKTLILKSIEDNYIFFFIDTVYFIAGIINPEIFEKKKYSKGS